MITVFALQNVSTNQLQWINVHPNTFPAYIELISVDDFTDVTLRNDPYGLEELRKKQKDPAQYRVVALHVEIPLGLDT